jgi:hypothetical protein
VLAILLRNVPVQRKNCTGGFLGLSSKQSQLSFQRTGIRRIEHSISPPFAHFASAGLRQRSHLCGTPRNPRKEATKRIPPFRSTVERIAVYRCEITFCVLRRELAVSASMPVFRPHRRVKDSTALFRLSFSWIGVINTLAWPSFNF